MRTRMWTAAATFRVGAAVLLLFAVGHTFGFLAFVAPTPAGRAVFDSMAAVHFPIGGGTYSYGDFYRGFGISITAYVLLMSLLTWQLSTLSRTQPNVARRLAWPMVALHAVNAVICVRYFSVAPAALSALLVALFVVAIWQCGGVR